MGRIRNSITRFIGLGLGVLVVGATLLAARPAPAGATILFPSISVGANMNLSQEVGNQLEGSVAIDPTNPNRMFVLGRDETGNLIGAWTSDGGATWIHSRMGTSILSPDHLPPAWGNTSVTFDSYGNLFVTYFSTTAWTYCDFGMSTDGSATFTHTTALAPFTDQPVVAAGHGEVWVMYNQGGVNIAQGASDTGPGTIETFRAPEAMPGANGRAFGDLSIGSQGQVVAAFGSLVARGPVIVSVDPDGLGPLGFQPAASVTTTNVGGFDYIPATPNWGIDAEVHLAWDESGGPHNGRLYLSYLDAPATDLGTTKLYVMHSDDGGVTWSTPVLVNDDGTSASHFMPALAVDQTTGTVGAIWYDTRSDPTRVSARYYGSVSVDGGDTWSPNFAIAAGTSDALLAAPPPTIRNTNWGDYTGLAFRGGVMVPVWADNSNSTANNPAGANSSFDLYTSLVTVTGATQAPAVETSPSPTTAVPGATYWFTASASGSLAPTVQWQRSNDAGITWSDIPGATAYTYSVTAALGDDGAEFRAVFTNSAGTATTAVATLNVTTTTSLSFRVAHTTLKGGKTDDLTVTLTSPVTGKGKVTGGTVAFYGGTTLVATAPLVTGKAKAVVRLAKGSHPLRAVYSGSGAVLAGPGSPVVTVTAT